MERQRPTSFLLSTCHPTTFVSVTSKQDWDSSLTSPETRQAELECEMHPGNVRRFLSVQVLNGLRQFGCYDDLYSLLNEYEIKPWETWTIEEKTIHAPGIIMITGTVKN